MRFWAIQRDGSVPGLTYEAPDAAGPVLATFSTMYSTVAYTPPWICYLASEDNAVVGTCGFKGPPADNRVEIAYITFPDTKGEAWRREWLNGC